MLLTYTDTQKETERQASQGFFCITKVSVTHSSAHVETENFAERSLATDHLFSFDVV